MGARGRSERSPRSWPPSLVAVAAAARDRPLPAQDLHLRRHQRARRRRARAAVRLRRAGLARPRRVRRARRVHVRLLHGAARLAVAARASPRPALVAALGGLVLALPSLRLKGHYLAMATLGFGELMSLAFVEAEPVTGGVDGFGGIPFPALGPVRDPRRRLALLARLGDRRRRAARRAAT